MTGVGLPSYVTDNPWLRILSDREWFERPEDCRYWLPFG